MVVAGAIVVTLATSAMPNVDWSAHLGGAVQGLLWGFILLSSELENDSNRVSWVYIVVCHARSTLSYPFPA